jgi:hypothetical protein
MIKIIVVDDYLAEENTCHIPVNRKLFPASEIFCL